MVSFDPEFRNEMKERMLNFLNHKEEVEKDMQSSIDRVIEIFSKYDTIQLLGSVGLKLLDSLPTIEKYFIAQMSGGGMEDIPVDEDAEVVAEYAMNYGLAMANDSTEAPTDEIVEELYAQLKQLKFLYSMIDMPATDDAEGWFAWMSHSNTISVRGDGYAEHLEEVFQEMFYPHSPFFQQKYGFSAEYLFQFCTTIENRLFPKIGNENTIWGAYVAYDRWREWCDKKYGDGEDAIEKMIEDMPDPSNPIMGAFLRDNPDMASDENPHMPLMYDTNYYPASRKIFWVVPQSDEERNLLETLSTSFGSNSQFITGQYRGNILNGPTILSKPIIKDEDKYYCFTPMLLHRNLFVIAEALLRNDQNYYNTHFQENTLPISRDNYIERKVREEFERILPNVEFHSSVNYHIVEDGVEKNPELDILGISKYYTYIIEVKAHELTHKDRVGINGIKTKFKGSITSACNQCCRAEKYIRSTKRPVFNDHGTPVNVDRKKSIIKIAVTFQHYSMLIGNIRKLIQLGLLEKEHTDVWIISLFDLMVLSDWMADERELVSYIEMRQEINRRGIVYLDELVLYDGFCNYRLKSRIQANKSCRIITGDTEFFDKEYSGYNDLPLVNASTSKDS